MRDVIETKIAAIRANFPKPTMAETDEFRDFLRNAPASVQKTAIAFVQLATAFVLTDQLQFTFGRRS